MSLLRRLLFRRHCRIAKRVLRRLDRHFKREGWPSWKRKQFWRDFTRSADLRADVADALERR